MCILKKILRRLRNCIENNIFVLPFRLLPVQNIILFESVPDLSDNSKAVFDEMIRIGLNKEYRMVWLVRDGSNRKLPIIDNVEYISAEGKAFKERMAVLKIKNIAKYLICCNIFLLRERKGQISFYLTHGTPIKYVKSYYTVPKKVDYCLAASPNLNSLVSDQFNIDEKKLFSLGFPRNDALTAPKRDLSRLFGKRYDKIIVWYPTFRQHKSGGGTASRNALPIIHDQAKAKKLNDFAMKQNTLIVVKPHFAQDISYIKDLNLNNIVFINDEFFFQNNISSYEFVGSCDALITDYSSIYFDYMLCDKPIGLVWEDYEEYKQNPGFAIDMDHYMKGAEKIYSLEEFEHFIDDVAKGNDVYAKERNEISAFVNYANDGENSKRVVSFILQHFDNQAKGKVN